uniref:Uncharacterized protein n=2 Tax=Kalanchoe fedtschenkoi TaxID=63787 RepID=A0A7N0TVM7_KALFE
MGNNIRPRRGGCAAGGGLTITTEWLDILLEGSAMEVGECDGIASMVDSALGRIKWRMRYASKRRLQIDILALCTRLRPVIMVDYGGKMPELQERLVSVIEILRKDFPGFEHLRVMIIEDMLYIIHVREFAEFISSSLKSELGHIFCDIGQDPPKIVLQTENSSILIQLKSLQNSLAELFALGEENSFSSPHTEPKLVSTDAPSTSVPIGSQSPQLIDLNSFLQETQVTIPTLNGWLLGYPVIYLFDKNQIADATYNLSTKFLHVYKVLVSRIRQSPNHNEAQQEELLSFTVPYDLSTRGSNEPWAKEFLAHMEAKLARFRGAWKSLHMEVSEFNPQAIVF